MEILDISYGIQRKGYKFRQDYGKKYYFYNIDINNPFGLFVNIQRFLVGEVRNDISKSRITPEIP